MEKTTSSKQNALCPEIEAWVLYFILLLRISTYPVQVHFKSNDPDEMPDCLFFSTRYIDCRGLGELEGPHPEVLKLKTETQADKAKVAAFIRLVSHELRVSLDPNVLSFGCMKDIHPYCDDRLVGSYLIIY